MEKRLGLAVLLIGLPIAAAAQHPGAEEEVRTFLAAYDKAVSARDVAFLAHGRGEVAPGERATPVVIRRATAATT